MLGATAAIRCEGLGAWSGASGSSGLDGLEPISVEARLPAYSLTKTMTSVCVMRMAEIGVLDIRDPISRWVSGLSFGEVSPCDESTHDFIALRIVKERIEVETQFRVVSWPPFGLEEGRAHNRGLNMTSKVLEERPKPRSAVSAEHVDRNP